MIVYGDRERDVHARDALAGLDASLREAVRVSGMARREALARLVIDLGSLTQALEDRAFHAQGQDELSPLATACARAALQAGRAFVAHHAREPWDACALSDALLELSPFLPSSTPLRLRDPEGYAFYALYPELYIEAARALRASGDVQVIGIRSIGSSLAALVAAATGSTRLPWTVRPTGHPFARELRLGPALRESVLQGRARCRYAIVDEGPGLSGSSFDAVASFLCAHGVGREQLVFFPSHGGEPGGVADEARRDRYRATARAFLPFERYFDGSSAERDLARWFAEEAGPAQAPLEDLSAGRWRRHFYPSSAPQPPSALRDERRKLLLRTSRGAFLLKFIGLGSGASAIAGRARELSDAGFTPRLLAVRHGFSLSTFEAGATPLPRARVPREQLVEQLGRYLSFLARRFPASPERGARPAQLLSMCAQNTRELLGEEQAAQLAAYEARLPALDAAHRAIRGDGKLERWEWLVTPDGRLLKSDAEEHHGGHDCIGCQDVAWDVAGAVIELALREEEREQLCERLLDEAGQRLEAERLRFYELAYAAFRAGRAQMAADTLRGWADADAALLDAERDRYRAALAARLPGASAH